MQASVEKTSAIGRKMSIVVPAEKIEQAVQTKLQQLTKKVKIQGFRPGKVPLKIVDQQYRGSATSEVLSDLMQSSLFDALQEENISPAVQPDVEPETFERDKDFNFVARFDVFPEFEHLDLKDVEVKRPVSEIKEVDIAKVVENMRKQKMTWKDVKRKSKKGDRIMIDFTGRIDGEEFAGGAATDHAMVTGDGQMLPEFDAAVIGKKAAESFEATVNFPEDYQEDLAGKTAVFEIEVKSVSESVLPEIDDEFIKSFGVESGDSKEFEKQVADNLSSNLDNQIESLTKQRVFDAILERNQADVPKKMVDEEINRMVGEQKNQLVQQGIDPKLLDQLPMPDTEKMLPQAQRRVALGLIMMEVIKKHDLQPDAEKVDARIEKMASVYEDPEQVIMYYKSDKNALEQVRSLVLEEQVVEFLLEGAKVEDENMLADELLNPTTAE